MNSVSAEVRRAIAVHVDEADQRARPGSPDAGAKVEADGAARNGATS